MNLHRKFADVDTLPMFDEPERHAPERQRRAPVAGFGACPHCRTHDRVALNPAGEHLVWREHYRRTGSNALAICPASGVALCAAPPRPDDQFVNYGAHPKHTTCPHDTADN